MSRYAPGYTGTMTTAGSGKPRGMFSPRGTGTNDGGRTPKAAGEAAITDQMIPSAIASMVASGKITSGKKPVVDGIKKPATNKVADRKAPAMNKGGMAAKAGKPKAAPKAKAAAKPMAYNKGGMVAKKVPAGASYTKGCK